jgi:hypothetical protein
MEHIIHGQEYDILGLTLQSSTSVSPHANELQTSNEALQPISHEQISACPVHSALVIGDHEEEDPDSPDIDSQRVLPCRGMGHTPIERYLAEGLAERYALFSPSQAETAGEWARYFGCLCET